MNRKKRKPIEARLEMIEERLANAQEYVAQNVNVEGVSFLHLDDWRGQSGHPSWMRNFMIPSVIKSRDASEKALQTIESKAKDKNLMKRKQNGASHANLPLFFPEH